MYIFQVLVLVITTGLLVAMLVFIAKHSCTDRSFADLDIQCVQYKQSSTNHGGVMFQIDKYQLLFCHFVRQLRLKHYPPAKCHSATLFLDDSNRLTLNVPPRLNYY